MSERSSGPLHPNDRLRMARDRQPSRTRPGRGMSRDELATAVNEWLHEHGVLDSDVDPTYIGKLERGGAPRGAWLYSRLSREELEGRFLGPMAYLEPKGEGDSSLPGKRWPCPGVWGGVPRDPRDMAKA